MSTHEAKVCQEPHELKLGMSCLCKFTPRMGLGRGQVAGRHLCERTISVLLSCVDMLTNTLPAPPQPGVTEAGGEGVMECAGDVYICVETQQCATNVILNPELHVLGIVFKNNNTTWSQ